MAVDIWTTVRWTKEASDRGVDPGSGAEITRMSGSALHTYNNYLPHCCSADGKRCLGIRLTDMLVGKTYALLAHDLETKFTVLLDENSATFEQVSVPFSGIIHYINDRNELCRISLDTFQRDVVMPMQGLPSMEDAFRTITADGRYLYYTTVMSIRDGLTIGIVRVDLTDGSWGIIYENSGFHSVMYLAGIDALLIGLRTLPDGSTPPLGLWVNLPGLSTACLLLKTDGAFIRNLGMPPGYISWLPSTGQMVSNCTYDYENSRHLPERPTGNMVVYASLDWGQPRVIDTPDHLCFHIARSKCERYVVSEAYRTGQGIHGPLDIVVANVQSGKYRVLVEDCGTHASGAAWRCATPYLTSDNRHVIYNADPADITHLYAARIPEGFLESLE